MSGYQAQKVGKCALLSLISPQTTEVPHMIKRNQDLLPLPPGPHLLLWWEFGVMIYIRRRLNYQPKNCLGVQKNFRCVNLEVSTSGFITCCTPHCKLWNLDWNGLATSYPSIPTESYTTGIGRWCHLLYIYTVYSTIHCTIPLYEWQKTVQSVVIAEM